MVEDAELVLITLCRGDTQNLLALTQDVSLQEGFFSHVSEHKSAS